MERRKEKEKRREEKSRDEKRREEIVFRALRQASCTSFQPETIRFLCLHVPPTNITRKRDSLSVCYLKEKTKRRDITSSLCVLAILMNDVSIRSRRSIDLTFFDNTKKKKKRHRNEKEKRKSFTLLSN